MKVTPVGFMVGSTEGEEDGAIVGSNWICTYSIFNIQSKIEKQIAEHWAESRAHSKANNLLPIVIDKYLLGV